MGAFSLSDAPGDVREEEELGCGEKQRRVGNPALQRHRDPSGRHPNPVAAMIQSSMKTTERPLREYLTEAR